MLMRTLGVALTLAAFALPAQAQTGFKWAHVYEEGPAYHQCALKAAEELRARRTGATRSRSTRRRPWARRPTSTRA